MRDDTDQEYDYKRQPPPSVFDGFCHRPYREDLDGWRMEQLEAEDFPSVQMARDVLSLFDEVNALRQENWRLRRRVEQLDKSGF